MKLRLLTAALLGVTLSAAAQQGYRDGVEYYRAGQPEDALTILERTINDASTDKATAYYYMGQIALDNKDFANAKSNFNAGIAANAENPYNYVGLGAIELIQGNKQAAEAQFKQAKSLSKKDADLLIDIARAYFNVDPVAYAKEIDKNINDAKKAEKTNPSIYVFEADRLVDTDINSAIPFYEMAQMYDTDNEHSEAYVKYARAYFHVNPRFSIDKLKELLAKQPNSALAQRELAEKYYDNNQFTLAAEQYGQYIQNPNHFDRDKQRYVGLLYFGKKYDESFNLACQLLNADPTNFYMQRMQLLNMAALERYEDAVKYGQEFFSNPKAQYVTNDYTTYAESLIKTGNNDLAIEQYIKAIELNPDKTALYKDLSAALTSAERYDEAAEAYQKFVDSGDATTNDLFMLARRYQNAAMADTVPESSRLMAERGLEIINTVMEKVPDNASVARTRAIIIFVRDGKEDTQEVFDAFKLVVDMLDKDPANLTSQKATYEQSLNRLGNFCIKNGDTEGAKLYFGRMLELNPDNEELQNFLSTLK